MNYENVAVNSDVARYQIIRFDVSNKWIHSRHERIKVKFIIQGVL